MRENISRSVGQGGRKAVRTEVRLFTPETHTACVIMFIARRAWSPDIPRMAGLDEVEAATECQPRAMSGHIREIIGSDNACWGQTSGWREILMVHELTV